MFIPTLLASLALCVEILALPAADWHYVVKENRAVPEQWSYVRHAPAEHILKLDIGLKQDRHEELEQRLWQVSDPDHDLYGQHLSISEVDELIKPSDSTLKNVLSWLSAHGVKPEQIQHTAAADWLTVELPISTAEGLLKAEYSVYKHEDGTILTRAPTWSLPRHLHDEIDMISPTTSFFYPRAKAKPAKPIDLWSVDDSRIAESMWGHGDAGSVARNCNASLVTTLCLRTLYGTLHYWPQVPGESKVGLADFLGESNNRSDVAAFLRLSRPEAVSAADSFTVEIVDNGNNEQTQETPDELDAGKDLEGNLDAETIIGIDYPIPLTAYTTGGSPPYKPDEYTTSDTNEPYLEWLKYVLAQSDVPQVISISYGDDEQTVPPSYAKRVCNAFAQLGARGVTVFVASGDNGVGPSGYCKSNDGKNTTKFIPDFPSSCPYVTTVGATKNFNPEVAAYDSGNGFASGGGFSEYFKRPQYQDAAVGAYLEKIGDKFAGLYTPHGRGYPDISAQGQRFLTIWNGSVAILDGTSASTPTAAAVFALVNDALLAAGKSPMGFLNPWLYSTGYRALTDVTSGSAIGCDTKGFPAKKGWDAVTGFGTPYFPSIKALLGC